MCLENVIFISVLFLPKKVIYCKVNLPKRNTRTVKAELERLI